MSGVFNTSCVVLVAWVCCAVQLLFSEQCWQYTQGWLGSAQQCSIQIGLGYPPEAVHALLLIVVEAFAAPTPGPSVDSL
mgnify:CR=1 FL=1